MSIISALVSGVTPSEQPEQSLSDAPTALQPADHSASPVLAAETSASESAPSTPIASAESLTAPEVNQEEARVLPLLPNSTDFEGPHPDIAPTTEAPSDQALKIIKDRFLRNFEFIELNPLLDLDLSDSAKKPDSHMHLQFSMSGEDRQKLSDIETVAMISRHVDRGTYLLQRLGVDVANVHLDKDHGALLYTVSPREPLPEGVSAEAELKKLADSLQSETTQIHANQQAAQSAPAH